MQEYIDFLVSNPLLSVAWVGLAGALVVTSIRARFSPIKNIGNQDAVQLINRQEAVVVDVRGQDEFSRGHIAGAVNVPVTQIEGNNLTLIEKHKAAPIIVVCESGARAQSAATRLYKAGFAQVFCLKGGLVDWRADNLPVTKKR